MIRPGMDDNPIASDSAKVQYSSRSESVFQTAREPISPIVLTHTSTRAISWRHVPSAFATSTCRTFARGIGACARPVAINPNAMPATVASIMIGNALLVPVLSGSIGVSPSPGAAARTVPSPPSSTTADEHRWAIIRAYSVVSVADPVGRCRVRNSISGSRTRADGGAARRRRTSRSTPAAIPKASVDSSTRSTPSAPTARTIRSTIEVFSVFGKTDACATTRRMSLPDIGFGIIPTALPETTGVGCSATGPSCTSSVDRLVTASM